MIETSFTGKPNRIDARFSHAGEFDYIALRIRFHGPTWSSSECDGQGEHAGAGHLTRKGLDFTVRMSSVWCPFHDFIHFLEAITVAVQTCAFEWDPEGPYGKMSWRHGYLNRPGTLMIEWHDKYQKIAHSIGLNRRQAVGMFYSAFRRFVESAEYNPFQYEHLTLREAARLILNDASPEDLANALAEMNGDAAYCLIERLMDVVFNENREGKSASHSLGYYLVPGATEHDPSKRKHWIDPEWNSWDRGHRMVEINEKIFRSENCGWHGANLRELRSPLIEAWLAQPEKLSPNR
ncbi:MAG: hypothetical protein KA388_02980 [Rhodocyclaceae bacterium]|nr:hypothetical protein [Rhodocyclaceae bacterium]MBP6109233.1 hypothetical protein [Rhodocyclaceae bacterium]MBP6278703.1 hypothetical protein [Rhodocyclaceae bacterium]